MTSVRVSRVQTSIVGDWHTDISSGANSQPLDGHVHGNRVQTSRRRSAYRLYYRPHSHTYPGCDPAQIRMHLDCVLQALRLLAIDELRGQSAPPGVRRHFEINGTTVLFRQLGGFDVHALGGYVHSASAQEDRLRQQAIGWWIRKDTRIHFCHL